MFKSAWDAALPVYAIGTALIFVFGSLLKTDERRSSVTLWDRSAQSQTPQKSHLPRKSRWRRTLFASVPIGTACPVGKPNRPSSLIRCHGNFWAEKRQSAFGSTNGQSRLSGNDPRSVVRSKPPLATAWRPMSDIQVPPKISENRRLAFDATLVSVMFLPIGIKPL